MADQIATLGIVVDANGAIRQVGQLDQKLQQLGATSVSQTRNMGSLNALHAEAVGHIGAHSLSYGRLENSVASFVGHAVGVPPVIEKITTAMGHFAVGSVELTGILIGMAAIAAAYDAITHGAAKAREEQEKLTKALSDRFKPTTGTGSDVLAEYNGALAAQASALQRLRILQSSSNDIGVARGYAAAGLAAPFRSRDQELDAVTQELAVANRALGRARANGAGILPTVTTNADLGPQRKAEEQAQAAINEFWAGQHRIVERAMEQVQDFKNLIRTFRRDNPVSDIVRGQIAGLIPTNISMPNTGINDGLTKEQIKQREKLGILVDDSNKNADKLHDAIWGAAAAGANAIVSALNIGGGGKGSGLGGALGGTAGFALGFAFGGGPIGGAIGSTLGNVIGSALGGLFDHHKKAIDRNTQALNDLSATLSNAPSGFKAAYYNYSAADPKMLYRSQVEEARRQRARGGKAGFELQASA